MANLRRSWIRILGTATLLAAAALALDPRARNLLREAPTADEITLAAAKAQQSALLWIDARPSADFARSHIPEAFSLSLDEWDTRIVDVLARWQPGTRVIVYCDDRACRTSSTVAEKLRREYQFDDVRILHGGWAAWQQEGGK
jgi:rhodanese-related sulfurtransferase